MNMNIIKKWEPIISILGYKGPKLNEIAMYMESHSNFESNLSLINLNNPTTTLLPLAVRILTKLSSFNLDNVKFTTDLITNDYDISVNLSIDDIMSIKRGELAYYYENILVEKSIEFIDKNISKIKNEEIIFNTPCLVKSLSVLSSKEQESKMVMTISYGLK